MEKINPVLKTKPSYPVNQMLIDFFDNNFGQENYLSLSEEFIQTMVQKIQADEKLKGTFILGRETFSFLDLDNYEREQISDRGLFLAMVNLSHLRKAIALELFPEEKAEEEKWRQYGILERQVSPPLSAYKYISFNKMDITHSKISYGTLFE